MRKDITVKALMKPTREIVPLSIVWEDDCVYNIDRVLDIRPSFSASGGMGLRYTVRIKGQIKQLFLDGFVWFIEI